MNDFSMSDIQIDESPINESFIICIHFLEECPEWCWNHSWVLAEKLLVEMPWQEWSGMFWNAKGKMHCSCSHWIVSCTRQCIHWKRAVASNLTRKSRQLRPENCSRSKCYPDHLVFLHWRWASRPCDPPRGGCPASSWSRAPEQLLWSLDDSCWSISWWTTSTTWVRANSTVWDQNDRDIHCNSQIVSHTYCSCRPQILGKTHVWGGMSVM